MQHGPTTRSPGAVATTTPAWCELPTAFHTREVRVQWASLPWMRQQALGLRRQVFCAEQGIFAGSDLDDVDALPGCRLLVALGCWGGHPVELLGTVRIHEAASGLWWGSRLAVREDWRHVSRVGTTLIQLAVCSAHALGCSEFHAHVQLPNVPLFQRLHWELLGRQLLHGREHGWMRADLNAYPPCSNPYAGFVVTRVSA